jgi:hypothetical protein
MVRMSLFTTVAAVAFLSFSTAGIAGPGEAGASKAGTKAISNCNGASRIFVTQSSSSQTTSSTAFVDVIGSLTSFTTTATKCVIIDFSAQAFAPPTASGLMFVRALLDGVTASVDGEIQFVAQSNTLSDAHSYNFVFPSVSIGAHNVRMQFRTNNAANAVTINGFNMVINHK